MTEVERKTRRRRRGKKGEGERERERSSASCSHYLTYYTGSMPPRPSRGPTSLHLASLGSPFALLTGLPSASSFCLPPAPSCSPSRLLTPDGFSRPLVSRHTRARLRAIAGPLPPRTATLPYSCPFFPLPSVRGRFLSFSIGGSFRASQPHPPPPFPHSLVLLLLPVPPRPPPPSILIDRSCTRARRAPLVVSSRLVSLSSVLCSFFFLFSLSFCLLSFRRLFLLRPLSPSCSLPPAPCPLLVRAAWYKLFQKFVLLLLSLNHSQRSGARDVHSSPVQCATLFAPC